MESIAYLPGHTASTRNTHGAILPFAAQGASCARTQLAEPTQELVKQFYAEAKRQIVKGDYLRRKWLPLYGPRFYSLIKALRGHCSYDITEGEARCYPSETTLAKECGVTRRTIITWLARVDAGEEQHYPGLKVGDFCHPRHGEALQQFLRIKAKLRYDRAGQRSVKAVNDYFVRMDDPPVPEDVPMIWAKAYEMAVQHLAHQAEEQEREARSPEFTATGAHAAFSGPAAFTSNNVKNLHAQQCEKSAHNPLFSTATAYPERDRTIPDQQRSAVRSRRSTPSPEKALIGGEAAAASGQQQTHSEAGQEPRRAAAATKTSQAAQPVLSPFEQALLAAEEEAGALLVEVLRQYGDADPVGGMKTILIALADAGAPVERLRDLIELGQNRLRRRLERGGAIRTTHQAYYIGIMQRLARQAQERGWNVVLMEAEDQAEHANIQRQRAMRRIGHQRMYIEPEPCVTEAAEEAAAPMEAEVRWTEADETVAPTAAGRWTDVDPRAVPTPDTWEGGQQEEASAEAQGDEGEAAFPPQPQEPREGRLSHEIPHRDGRARQIWQSTLVERIQPKISPAMFNAWFAGTSGRSLCGQVLTVAVRTTFNRSHLETRFHDLVCSSLCDLVGPEAEVDFVITPQEEDAWNPNSI